jgi:signal transduction histidine kinase
MMRPIRDGRGRTCGFTKVARDMTERRRAEEERAQLLAREQEARREAEAASRAKDQFLAVLSHELRTPLNPILLATSAILEGPEEPEEVRPTLEMIRQNVHLQARLIDDLLDVMRIVRGKMPLHWEVADGHRLIDQAIQICRSEVFCGELRLELDLAATHRHVNADPARLQQVFWNLIKNAVKFTPEGGTIAIRTRNEDGQGVEHLIVEVSDTGIGIEPEVLPRIFDPFQQGETTITREFGGLGLGLAICKGIVDAHGGTIGVDSVVGRGTTVTVTLPLASAPMAPAETAG